MDCNAARPLIHDDLDGRLDAADREPLDAHLESCAECRAVASELAELRRLFAAVPPVSAPAGLRDSVMSRLTQRPARRGKLLRMAPWLAAAAAAVLVTVSVLPGSPLRPSARPTDTASAPAATASRPMMEADEAPLETRDRAAPTRTSRQANDELADGPEQDAKEMSRDQPTALEPGRDPSSVPRGRPSAPTDAPVPTPVGATRVPAPPAPPPAAVSTGTRTEGKSEFGKKKGADGPGETTVVGSAARHIVVFSDRREAERFVAALRGASAPTPGLAGGDSGASETEAADAVDAPAAPRPPAARSPAPDAGERGARRRDQAEEKLERRVATAGASRLAEAAESGNALVLARLPVRKGSPQVDALLRDALAGRAWAAPLSERLYARAAFADERRGSPPADTPTAAGEDDSDDGYSGPQTGAGAGAGGAGGGPAGGKPTAGKDRGPGAEGADAEPRATAEPDAGRLRETVPLEIVVLVLAE